MDGNLARTPLHGWHASHGGQLVEFGGWSMPVQYTSLVQEHQATRTAVGLFDISHMGRLRFDGPRAGEYLDSIVTRRVIDMQPGQARYALVTNEQGGVLDDVLVYRLQDAAGGTYHLLVVNAGNRPKILAWLQKHPAPADVQLTDLTTAWAMIAVQGPRAGELLQPICDGELTTMKYYAGREARIGGGSGIVSRTGYTGEDGYEIIVGAPAAVRVWENLVERAGPLGGLPCGLGARNTLRLEAAMALYGHELTEETNPLQAGLKFAVDLEKAAYPGRDALRRISQQPSPTTLVGLEAPGKRAPRDGYTVLSGGRPVGKVTSGTYSPTLQKSIAMAYVERAVSSPGTSLEVDVRGQLLPVTVVKLPFYRRQK
ncbi:MAG: glycine cleavage system aminomethyltransferase GcvT [Planctomycetia bacterium]|nr:glycine cleavage system aminomethyltransferase GcvT [Planctomycetia bacterium]